MGSIKVTWTQNGEPYSGILTRKALPDSADKELPIIMRDGVGPSMLPSDLKGVVIECARSQAGAYPELVQEARKIGYEIIMT